MVTSDPFVQCEYLKYECKEKFSKSRKVGVFGDDAKLSGIPADVWRYYLLSIRPESSDSEFTWSGLKDANNNELLHNLGNLVSRVVSLINTKFNGKITNDVKCTPAKLDSTFTQLMEHHLNEYLIHYGRYTNPARPNESHEDVTRA